MARGAAGAACCEDVGEHAEDDRDAWFFCTSVECGEVRDMKVTHFEPLPRLHNVLPQGSADFQSPRFMEPSWKGGVGGRERPRTILLVEIYDPLLEGSRGVFRSSMIHVFGGGTEGAEGGEWWGPLKRGVRG